MNDDSFEDVRKQLEKKVEEAKKKLKEAEEEFRKAQDKMMARQKEVDLYRKKDNENRNPRTHPRDCHSD